MAHTTLYLGARASYLYENHPQTGFPVTRVYRVPSFDERQTASPVAIVRNGNPVLTVGKPVDLSDYQSAGAVRATATVTNIVMRDVRSLRRWELAAAGWTSLYQMLQWWTARTQYRLYRDLFAEDASARRQEWVVQEIRKARYIWFGGWQINFAHVSAGGQQ